MLPPFTYAPKVRKTQSFRDLDKAEESWRLAETEFYASPFFRMHHAYHLTKNR